MTQPAPSTTPPASDPAPTPASTAPQPQAPVEPKPMPSEGDKPLGPAGERALAAEREARKALEKKYAPLDQLLTALTGGAKPEDGKSEVDLLKERFAQHEQTLAQEREARWRAEVAHAKGLTPQQAERLRGASREELEADADQLLSLFPAAPRTPGVPAPDPTQGARGSGPGSDLESLIAEAQRQGDVRKVIALQKQKLANATR